MAGVWCDYVPEWTDVTDWAAVCDPMIAPSIMWVNVSA